MHTLLFNFYELFLIAVFTRKQFRFSLSEKIIPSTGRDRRNEKIVLFDSFRSK